jgi:hypothetical protein
MTAPVGKNSSPAGSNTIKIFPMAALVLLFALPGAVQAHTAAPRLAQLSNTP